MSACKSYVITLNICYGLIYHLIIPSIQIIKIRCLKLIIWEMRDSNKFKSVSVIRLELVLRCRRWWIWIWLGWAQSGNGTGFSDGIECIGIYTIYVCIYEVHAECALSDVRMDNEAMTAWLTKWGGNLYIESAGKVSLKGAAAHARLHPNPLHSAGGLSCACGLSV